LKKLALALTLFAACGTTKSIAADMAVKALPMPAPVASWTGFYAGVNAGYGRGDASSTNNPVDPASQIFFSDPTFGTTFNTAFRQAGAIAGVQVGYNWQFSGQAVFGFEADLQYSDMHGTGIARTLPLFGGFIEYDADTERRLRWFGTVRGRLGFLVTPNLLLYGTGGLAYGETESRGDIKINPLLPNGQVVIQVIQNQTVLSCRNQAPASALCYQGSNSETQLGWAAGAGGEWKLAPNWSLKAEYLHVGLPGTSATLSAAAPSTPDVKTVFKFNSQNFDLVRLGVNYQFGGPIVAKY
jgi:outer membrane immunogenic protein